MRIALLIVVVATSSASCATELERGDSPVTGASGGQVAPRTLPPQRSAAEQTQGGETKGCQHPARVTPAPGQCDGLPADYGLSPANPLEWGFGAMMGLGGDALMCENGGHPESRREGSLVAPPEYKPTGPQVGMKLKTDMIDMYEVTCPGDAAPRHLYVNAYRCGAPCFPTGLRAMSPEAFHELSVAITALEHEQYAEALPHAQRALQLEPTSELTHSYLATALFVLERYADAFPEFQKASALDPKNPYYRLHGAMSKLAVGDAHYYRTVVEQLLAELPKEHPLIDELHCRQAHALKRDNELDRAKSIAAAACTAGQKECCW